MTIKKAIIFIFFVAVATLSVRAQTWVKQQLDDRVSVKFPGTPTNSTMGPTVLYRYTDKDSLAYSANMVDFMAVAQLDSAKLAAMKDTPEFAEGMKQGMSRIAKGYEFGDVALGKWKGYSSYSITGTNAEKKTKVYMQMVLIGSKAFYITCVVPNAAPAKGKDDYFTTLELGH